MRHLRERFTAPIYKSVLRLSAEDMGQLNNLTMRHLHKRFTAPIYKSVLRLSAANLDRLKSKNYYYYS